MTRLVFAGVAAFTAVGAAAFVLAAFFGERGLNRLTVIVDDDHHDIFDTEGTRP